MIDEKAFIPHLQGCEMLVSTPDDWHVPCGDPATELVLSEGHRRYVCDWHYRRATDVAASTPTRPDDPIGAVRSRSGTENRSRRWHRDSSD